jgi:hypothetical protein
MEESLMFSIIFEYTEKVTVEVFENDKLKAYVRRDALQEENRQHGKFYVVESGETVEECLIEAHRFLEAGDRWRFIGRMLMNMTEMKPRIEELRALREAAKPLPDNQTTRVGEAMNALDDDRRRRAYESAALTFVADLLSNKIETGYCSEGDRCVCGGDTEGVRRSCGNWVK